MIAQDERDMVMAGLIKAMYDLYGLVSKADLLQGVDKDRKKLLKDMAMQTAECAYFIRDQSQVKSFCKYVTY